MYQPFWTIKIRPAGSCVPHIVLHVLCRSVCLLSMLINEYWKILQSRVSSKCSCTKQCKQFIAQCYPYPWWCSSHIICLFFLRFFWLQFKLSVSRLIELAFKESAKSTIHILWSFSAKELLTSEQHEEHYGGGTSFKTTSTSEVLMLNSWN